MGFDDETAASAVRVSLGPATREAELLDFAAAWGAQHRRFRQKAA
jgi:cysteine desulfurase